jgi:hypothetical protein
MRCDLSALFGIRVFPSDFCEGRFAERSSLEKKGAVDNVDHPGRSKPRHGEPANVTQKPRINIKRGWYCDIFTASLISTMIRKTPSGWCVDIQPAGRGGKCYGKTFKAKGDALPWETPIKARVTNDPSFQLPEGIPAGSSSWSSSATACVASN